MSVATESGTFTAPAIRQTGILIGDEWQPAVSGKTFQTINPATEEVICEVAEGDKEDVIGAIDRLAVDPDPDRIADPRQLDLRSRFSVVAHGVDFGLDLATVRADRAHPHIRPLPSPRCQRAHF